MDIRSIGSASPSGQLITDRATGPDTSAPVSRSAAASTQTIDAVKAVSSASAPPEFDKVTKAVDDINKTIQSLSQSLEFSVEEHSNKVVVKVVDLQTKEVLRQIPSEEALEISRSLDKLQGLLIKQQA
ncbi:flagellar protein FlaG [Undibacterium sp. YM2]|jgi:flagellar protein FlaG|uniref:flagellar protein FlaG n=1 Tax=Undibacterium sp. YM2 TaxID=2058625 RepID=UPI001331C444|nr:flagellar protein FlaG [Undibacterium sp. YM2]BBB66505.1 flagellar protein FlaG [Undibacterium sp. YM2]